MHFKTNLGKKQPQGQIGPPAPSSPPQERPRKRMRRKIDSHRMEINPYTNLIKRIHEKVNNGQEDRILNDLIHLLYDITLQSSGFSLDDPVSFSKRILKFIDIGLGSDDNNVLDDNDVSDDNDLQKNSQTSNDIKESIMEEVD